MQACPCSSHTTRFLRREAKGVLDTLPKGKSYPVEEAAWLVATCWNRGITLMKQGVSPEVAVQFMQARRRRIKGLYLH